MATQSNKQGSLSHPTQAEGVTCTVTQWKLMDLRSGTVGHSQEESHRDLDTLESPHLRWIWKCKLHLFTDK